MRERRIKYESRMHMGRCLSLKYNQNNTCPCNECVVKVMCAEACFRWKVWLDDGKPVRKGKMINHKDCEGCAYDYDVAVCIPKQDGTCPCGSCVVKMMCGEPCPEWGRWYNRKEN